MERVVITGGAGFVGSAVIRELLANQVEVWAVVREGFSAKVDKSRLAGLPVHLVECSLQNIECLPQLVTERGFDAWYQFAWDGLFGAELLDYHKQLANVEYLLNALCVASELKCKKFIGSGSISQYELQIKSDRPIGNDKHCVYKTAKLACEYMGNSVASQKGIQFIWPIITNIFGVGEKSPRLINTMIRNLQAGKHQALSEGNQIYDFIYISDAAKAFRLIGESGKQNRTYVIANGNAQPLKDFLCKVRDVVSPEAELGFGEMEFNGFYLPPEVYSTAVLEEDTGFSPEVTFEDAIRRTAAWIKDIEEPS